MSAYCHRDELVRNASLKLLYVSFNPSPRLYRGFHPNCPNLDESINFLGVPSGRDASNINSPSNPTTSQMISANDFIETSWPVPTLMCSLAE